MAALQALEVTCSFTVVPWTPLNPFCWALLKTLRTFPPGRRPGYPELAARLRVDDPSFLEQAWTECIDLSLIFPVGSLQEAELSDGGQVALSRGYVTAGKPYRHEGETLYFKFYHFEPIRWWPHLSVVEGEPTPMPKWAKQVTPECVIEAIAVQRENAVQRIGENERIEFLVVDWTSARRVGISTDRKDIP